jgi:hypothetical protein
MNRKPFAKLPHNARVEDFLAANGLPGVKAKWLSDGSLKNTFRLSGYEAANAWRPRADRAAEWTPELADKLNALGFRNYNGQPFDRLDGNGGLFHVFSRPPCGLDPRNVCEVASPSVSFPGSSYNSTRIFPIEA